MLSPFTYVVFSLLTQCCLCFVFFVVCIGPDSKSHILGKLYDSRFFFVLKINCASTKFIKNLYCYFIGFGVLCFSFWAYDLRVVNLRKRKIITRLETVGGGNIKNTPDSYIKSPGT